MEFIQTVIGLALHILSEVDFEAIPVIPLLTGNVPQACISFGRKRNILNRFPVDRHIGVELFFFFRIVEEGAERFGRELNVDLVNERRVEKSCRIICDSFFIWNLDLNILLRTSGKQRSCQKRCKYFPYNPHMFSLLFL